MGVLLGACDGPAADRGLRRRRGGGPPRPQRPAAALDHHHPRLRPRGQRADRAPPIWARWRCSASSAPATPPWCGSARGGAAHRGRAARGGAAALPDAQGPSRGPLLRRPGRGAGRARPAAGRLRHDEGRPGRRPRPPRRGRASSPSARWATTRRPRPCSTIIRAGSTTTSSCASPRRRRLPSTPSATPGCSRRRWPSATARACGTRRGGPHYVFPHRILSAGELCWLSGQERVAVLDATFPAPPRCRGSGARALAAVAGAALAQAREMRRCSCSPTARWTRTRAPLPGLRLVAASTTRSSRPASATRSAWWPTSGSGTCTTARCSSPSAPTRSAPGSGSLTAGEHEETLPEGPAHRLRGSHVDDRRDPGLGLLRRQARGGGGPRSRVSGGRVSRGGRPPGGSARRCSTASGSSSTREAFDPETQGSRRTRASSATVREGRPHFNGPDAVRALHEASGYRQKARLHAPGSPEAYADVQRDRLGPRAHHPARPAAGEGGHAHPDRRGRARGGHALALHGPGHERGRALRARPSRGGPGHERAPPLLPARFKRAGRPLPEGIGPIANSGEGGFDKARIGTRDGNRSVQYAGARFTITPMTAARAAEAEVKFAQGAKPGKGGQLPGQEGLGPHRAPARLRARLRAGLAPREPQPLLDRGRQAHARELAPPQPAR